MIDYGALILNVTDINPDWQQSGIKLPAGRGPTYLHLSRESAETELLRLQAADFEAMRQRIAKDPSTPQHK